MRANRQTIDQRRALARVLAAATATRRGAQVSLTMKTTVFDRLMALLPPARGWKKK